MEIGPDGSIHQVPITSCGLNGGPLDASGLYPASIACHLTDPTVVNKIDYQSPVMSTQVKVTEQQNQSYITLIKDETTVGYKYFAFKGSTNLLLELRGTFSGSIIISHDEAGDDVIGKLTANVDTESWQILKTPVEAKTGCLPLYIHFKGKGSLDLKSLGFCD